MPTATCFSIFFQSPMSTSSPAMKPHMGNPSQIQVHSDGFSAALTPIIPTLSMAPYTKARIVLYRTVCFIRMYIIVF